MLLIVYDIVIVSKDIFFASVRIAIEPLDKNFLPYPNLSVDVTRSDVLRTRGRGQSLAE